MVTLGDGSKVHIVLMDVRYDYNQSANDRIGEKQYQWLRKVLSKDLSANLTIIVSGIQIMPDRVFIIECFNWKNKKKLLIDLIRNDPEIRKDGYIFLSGDVHFA